MQPRSGIPDWRDAQAYAELLRVDRSGLAWEWLRRDRHYGQAARRAVAGRPERGSLGFGEDPSAAPWGLHTFEDPDLPASLARPVWRSDRFAPVIRATAKPWRDDSDALNLSRFAALATLVGGCETQHLLLSDGYRSLRLDVAGAGLGGGPARLHFALVGFHQLPSELLALRQLAALAAHGRFAAPLHPPVTRTGRMVLMLRTYDAVAAGASQRSIAAELLSATASESRWRVHSPSIRSQVQRLVRSATSMASGGFWALLNGNAVQPQWRPCPELH